MNKIKSILMVFASLLIVFSCSKDQPFGSTDFVDGAPVPSDLSVLVDIHPDQTGNVTISPTGNGVTYFGVLFGDATTDTTYIEVGSSTEHMYAEGTYDLKILGYNTARKMTETVQSVEVSLSAPENVVIDIANEMGVSKKVNVTAKADYGQSFDVYFGESVDETPVTGNIGETVSFVYQEAGNYDIKVVVKSASATTYEEIFNWDAILFLQPAIPANLPPGRVDGTYISIFSDAYTDIEGTNFNPDWGQSGQGSSYSVFDLDGDAMQQYINLSYQGIEFTDQDVSGMDYIHMDVWTGTLTQLEVSLIQRDGDPVEKPVTVSLTPDSWNTIDIPVADYVSQGLTVDQIFQIKLVATGTDEWATGSIFVDNIYFYQAIELPTSFEASSLFAGDNFFSFGGVNGSIIDNPDASGINTSSKVLSAEKTAGAETWGGTGYVLANPIDFTNGTKVSLKVWSPRVGAQMLFKLENLTDNTIVAEVFVNSTVANQWEELVFDLTTFAGFDASIEYSKIIIFPDFGTVGQGETFYFDDAKLVN